MRSDIRQVPQKSDNPETPARLHFPEDEAKLPWLPMLLDAYAVIDKGVALAIGREEKKRKVRLACAEGCDRCCHTHKDIPLYPLEVVGIYWFAIEKMGRSLREILKRQLSSYTQGDACPFLVNRSCSIHPLRPVACRQFNVFNKPCEKDEDPYYARRGDVLTPLQEYTNEAFFIMLPFYGFTSKADRMRAIKNKLIHTQVSNLKSCNWKVLSRRMDDFDARAPGSGLFPR